MTKRSNLPLIVAAYEEARKELAKEGEKPLLAWEALSPALRRAFIHVYHQGGIDLAREKRKAKP
jgi:hypothetical protein